VNGFRGHESPSNSRSKTYELAQPVILAFECIDRHRFQGNRIANRHPLVVEEKRPAARFGTLLQHDERRKECPAHRARDRITKIGGKTARDEREQRRRDEHD
jgi:hypothetical protein